MIRAFFVRRVRFVLRAALHARARTALAVAGTGFAVFLIFAELLFDSTIVYTSGAISRRLDFDLMVVSSGFREVMMSAPFPRRRLVQALGVPGVAGITPVYRALTTWQHPDVAEQARIVVLGIIPEDHPIRLPEARELETSLRRCDAIAADRAALGSCGPIAVGSRVTVRRHRVDVASLVSVGVGFLCDGAVLASTNNYARITGADLEDVHLGLVRLRPGADREAVAAALRLELSSDIQVLTPPEVERQQRAFWEQISSSGKITRAGVALALVVALVVLLQVLSTEVIQRLPEFATLAALGYDRRAIRDMVLRQAILVAAAGYALGLVLALPLPGVLGRAVHMPLAHSPLHAAVILAGIAITSRIAGLLALRRLERSDPAELF
jgi:putative ABC transport system permease protein